MNYNNLLVDLHCHSDISDGLLSPRDLAYTIHNSNINTWSLTDHDTVDGLSEAQNESKKLDLAFINGVEISSDWDGRTIHILGLYIDYNNNCLLEGLESNINCRKTRAFNIVKHLDSLGFHGSDSLLSSRLNNKSSIIGRLHFARFLVQSGYCKSIKKVFLKYLSDDFFKNSDKYAPLHDVISWIKNAGGVAVIAHPLNYKFSNIELDKLMERFADLGGECVEIPLFQNHKNYELIIYLIKKYNFYISCGSDFHSFKDNLMTKERFSKIPSDLKNIWCNFL
ncbi:PHP domain-containing protein [Candidatus Kinetoplastidibacterium crithidiae]|uniref:PHP family metal-dependent phosphoesterase n=1 Tax=Candidatus Kinetoplastidibacterium crithidiae TCC036E TaxID=1208918 RepID=M1L4F4_9PROT|nr:PHP domain-containing protein [Candidatus Kinetoplastibacterium crithidii]AFZ82751.1 phosphoesterase [Candidatus Kinetoplastibacterium crithidii (ex Angomonas deanei ATCC 30255)]AGF47598.1 PHP family metal-dependent phosphoesterase [Candidatus Kinetoplastibacterium crithidii TCC036E]